MERKILKRREQELPLLSHQQQETPRLIYENRSSPLVLRGQYLIKDASHPTLQN